MGNIVVDYYGVSNEVAALIESLMNIKHKVYDY